MRPPVSTCDLITVGPPIRSRDRPRLGGVGRAAVVGDGDAGALDDLARLELEESHGGAEAYRALGRCAASAVGESAQRGADLSRAYA